MLTANIRPLSLIADIGGTNARFALVDDHDGVIATQILACADYATIEDAVHAYLRDKKDAMPRRAAIAIAGPVTGDAVSMTNHPWHFSINATRAALNLDALYVLNDLEAAALAVPLLKEGEYRQVGEGHAAHNAPIGVLAPGTGLGVASLVPVKGNFIAVPGEGGHVTMAARTDREAEVLNVLRHKFSHVSAERVVSGKGLPKLYDALRDLWADKIPNLPERDAPEITAAGLSGECPVCVEALELFCAFLGTMAGNLALTLGARGGIFIAGGIVPKLGDYFATSLFRTRFSQKGRFRDYLEPIPTYVIHHGLPAFLGLQAFLETNYPHKAGVAA